MKYFRVFKSMLLGAGFLAVSGVAMMPADALAMPNYSRQMNTDCSSCHFQHFPKLNAYGRSFKASGFSMTAQESLSGKNMSMQPTLNAGYFIKTRVWDDDNTKAKWDFPDESALLLGGRLAEGMGGMLEVGDDLLSYKVSLTRHLAGMDMGATAFATDGLGAAYGFELFNTGTMRNHRAFERAHKVTQGQNGLDLTGAASGVAFHTHNSDFFAALTFYMPDSVIAGHTKRDAGTDLSTYARVAWTPNIGGHDVGVGVGVHSGKTKATCDDASLCTAGVMTEFVTEAWLVDAQFQGKVGGKELGLYFVYAKGGEDEGAANTVYVFNGGQADAPSGWGLDAAYSLNDEVHLLGSVSRHDNGHATKSEMSRLGLGVYWLLAQNISLQPMYESFSGDQAKTDKRMTVMFQTAF